MVRVKNVLVTGGAGFIGSHVTRALLSRGDRVICLDNFNDYYSPKVKELNIAPFLSNPNYRLYRGDITDAVVVEEIFKKERVNYICHLAARPGVRPSIEMPTLYAKANVDGTVNILDIAQRFGVENIVIASSSSVYGVSDKPYFSENDVADKPMSPYAATKRAAEIFAGVFHDLYGLNINVLRFFTVYGPAGRPDMAPFLFTRWIDEGVAVKRFGDGRTRRDYTFIDDAVSGIIAALDKPLGYEIFNIGNSESVELNFLISVIEKHLGKKAIIKEYPPNAGDVPFTCADISKARKMLGYHPKTKIDEGMGKFIDWYRANKNFYS